jgi:hypothetical protein
MKERLIKAAYDAFYENTSYVGEFMDSGTVIDGEVDLDLLVTAILKEMREPTETMMSAENERGEGIHANCQMCGGALHAWHLMIDEAMK